MNNHQPKFNSQPLIIVLLVALAQGTGARASCEATSLPPAEFKLDDVVIQFIESGGLGSSRSIELRGTGMVSTETTSIPPATTTHSQYSVSPDEVIALLNEFYSLSFFDLGPHYGQWQRVRHRPDGKVETLGRITADAGGGSLILRIGSYEKCVHYSAERPQLIDVLVGRLENLARSRDAAKP